MAAVAMPRRQRGDHRHRAEQLIARDYEALRSDVLKALRGRLARQSIFFDDSELDAVYNQAWMGLYTEYVEGTDVANPGGFLTNAAYYRAIDEFRRKHPDRWADDGQLAERVIQNASHDVDLAAQLDDYTKLRQFIESLRDSLSKRECEAAALCYIRGYSRPEAAKLLGVEPKRMEKIMDAVSKKIGRFVRDIEAGVFCEKRRSLMNAFAFGVLDPDGERYELAQAHLEDCAGCRAYVRSARGIAAIIPPSTLPLKLAGGHIAALFARVKGRLLAGKSTAATASSSSGTTATVAGSTGAKIAIAAAVLVTAGAASGATIAHHHHRSAIAATAQPPAPAIPFAAPTADRPPTRLLLRLADAEHPLSHHHHLHRAHNAIVPLASPSAPTRAAALATQAAAPAAPAASPAAGGPAPSQGSGSGEFGVEG
jgi:DNA-directed RNA polymerase specialized sigma24 family protein